MASALPQLIVALDNCPTLDEARTIVREVSHGGVTWFKVGLELYTKAGPSFIDELKSQGLSVFLDLKLYDIPNTVEKAVNAACSTGADLLTIHASGGVEMMAAAQNGAAHSSLSLLGVTVLTSFGGEPFDQICEAWGSRAGTKVPRNAVALRLAQLTAKAGLSGIVCSVSDLHDGEIQKLSWRSSNPFFVTPGIRNMNDASNDQKSVATVAQAVQLGATHLVVGRPITSMNGSRANAAAEFLRQIKETHGLASHS